jgi:hypothetical protein
MEQAQKNIFSIINKFNAKLNAHGLKLSAEEVADQAEAMKFMAEAALEDGTIVYTPAESWSEGVEIFVKDADGNMVAVPDGDIKTADGSIISVQGGRVTAIAPAEVESEQPMEEAACEPVKQEQAVETFTKSDVEAMIAEALNGFAAQLSAKNEEVKSLQAEVTAIKEAHTALSKQAAAQSVKQTAVSTPKKTMNQIDSVQARINELINRK